MTRAELVDRIIEGLREAGLSMSQVQFQALREADRIGAMTMEKSSCRHQLRNRSLRVEIMAYNIEMTKTGRFSVRRDGNLVKTFMSQESAQNWIAEKRAAFDRAHRGHDVIRTGANTHQCADRRLQ